MCKGDGGGRERKRGRRKKRNRRKEGWKKGKKGMSMGGVYRNLYAVCGFYFYSHRIFFYMFFPIPTPRKKKKKKETSSINFYR